MVSFGTKEFNLGKTIGEFLKQLIPRFPGTFFPLKNKLKLVEGYLTGFPEKENR